MKKRFYVVFIFLFIVSRSLSLDLQGNFFQQYWQKISSIFNLKTLGQGFSSKFSGLSETLSKHKKQLEVLWLYSVLLVVSGGIIVTKK
jgi:hypothetical protein